MTRLPLLMVPQLRTQLPLGGKTSLGTLGVHLVNGVSRRLGLLICLVECGHGIACLGGNSKAPTKIPPRAMNHGNVRFGGETSLGSLGVRTPSIGEWSESEAWRASSPTNIPPRVDQSL